MFRGRVEKPPIEGSSNAMERTEHQDGKTQVEHQLFREIKHRFGDPVKFQSS